MGLNPCPCWNLKDGCVTVGIWSLVFCVIQLAIFGWQTAAIKNELDKSRNSMWGFQRPYVGDQERYYQEGFYQNQQTSQFTALFIVQILVLIVTFFLLFASVGLIYGIHTESKYLVWPWFPCAVLNILGCMAYCIIWWTASLTGYWVVLTIIEIIGVIINIYCFICVISQYGQIGRASSNEKLNAYYYDDSNKQPMDPTVVYYNQQGANAQIQTQAQGPYKAPIPANDGGFSNMGYDPIEQAHKVHLYSNYEGQQPPTMQKPQQAAGTVDDFANAWLYNQPVPGAGGMQQQHMGQPGASTWQQQQQQNPQPGQPYPYPGVGSAQQIQTEPNTPTNMHQKLPDNDQIRPAKSEPDFTADKSHKHRRARSVDRHQHRRNKHRGRSAYSSDSDRSDDTGTHDKRSRCSRHRHHSSRSSHRHHQHTHASSRHNHNHTGGRSRSRNRHQASDLDEATLGTKPAAATSGDEKQRRTMRDVKRTAAQSQSQNNRPATASPSALSGTAADAVPLGRSSAGGITIPQKIVIPPSKGGRKEPQRFHINSEITISYSDRSTNPSDAGGAVKRRQAVAAGNTNSPAAGQPAPVVVTPSDNQSKSRPVSFESHGSTAV